jgi:diguanylate cyclase (GGDEF)-like protein
VLLLADSEAAVEIAERLRRVIEGTIVRDFPQVDFTASLGVATASGVIDTRDAVIAAADAYLYEAKTSGRNCVKALVGVPLLDAWD